MAGEEITGGQQRLCCHADTFVCIPQKNFIVHEIATELKTPETQSRLFVLKVFSCRASLLGLLFFLKIEKVHNSKVV